MDDIIAIVPGVVGASLLAYGSSRARRALASRKWPETRGRIIAVNVAKIWIGRGSVYYPEVRYEYVVGDAKLEGTRIGFVSTLPSFSHGATVYALQHTYPRGKPVTIRYNPSDSSDTVLEPGIGTGLRSVLGTGALLVAVAIAAVIFARLLNAAAT